MIDERHWRARLLLRALGSLLWDALRRPFLREREPFFWLSPDARTAALRPADEREFPPPA